MDLVGATNSGDGPYSFVDGVAARHGMPPGRTDITTAASATWRRFDMFNCISRTRGTASEYSGTVCQMSPMRLYYGCRIPVIPGIAMSGVLVAIRGKSTPHPRSKSSVL